MLLAPRQREIWHRSFVARYYKPYRFQAYSDFNYYPLVWKHHKDIILTSDPGSADWHIGIVGSQLIWDERDSKAQSQFIRNDEDYKMNQTDATIASRSSNAPKRLQSYQELQEFVSRLVTHTAFWFPECHLRVVAEALETHLSQNKRTLSMDRAWMHHKCSEIPHWLKRVEYLEFNHDFSEEDFQPDKNFDHITVYANSLIGVAQICSMAKYYSSDHMPPSLRPPFLPGNGQGNQGQQQQWQQPQQQRQQQGQQQQGQPQQGQGQQQQERRDTSPVENRNLHRKFKEHWRNCNDAQRRMKMGQIFRNASTGAPQVGAILELAVNDCVNWNVKGRCIMGCAKTHSNPRLPDAKVDEVVVILKRSINLG